MERRVIIIVGPTASGKTSLSIELAKALNSEIISADSRQVYKYLNIGTAKPSPDEMGQIKHHLIDCLNPDAEYNASRFESDALGIIENLFAEGKTSIVAGGSGLYIKALVDGIFNSVDTDEEYRKELLEKRKEYGDNFLYEELKKVDPESASKMLPQNWKRVIRALEVFHLTGTPIGRLQKEYERNVNINFIQFGLNWDRNILYSRVEKRVDKMIEAGLVDETKKILELGYSKELNSLNTVGYKEVIDFLEGTITLDRAVELIKRNTRRFAKRQMTWFRKDERIKWIDIHSAGDFGQISGKIFKSYL